MNGRIYDPQLGRFLSADILVSNPENLQNYNRFTYCGNNPTTTTDPSGFQSEAEKEERRRAMEKWANGTRTLYVSPGSAAEGASTVAADQSQANARPNAQVTGVTPGPGDKVNTLRGGIGKNGDRWVTDVPFDDSPASNNAGIDPNCAGEIGTYLVRQNAAGEWIIVGKTNGVTTANAYVNGILEDLGRHAQLGGIHIQARFGAGVKEFTLFNNPSKGFFRDIWETTLDKLGFTSAPAMELAGVLQGVQASGQSVEWIAHSQGGAIFSEAMRFAGGSLSANSVTFNAGANNHWVTNSIAADVGVQVRGYYYSSWDAVPNVIGMNGNPFSMVGSVLAAPLLFTDEHSPHTAPTSGWRRR